jgi:hypothetical protein
LGGIAIAFSFEKGRQEMTGLTRFLAASLAAGYMLFSPSAHADSVREAVESGNRAFIAAFLRGDARAVAELYTEGAQVIAPGAPIASGRSAIAAAWQATINTGVKDLTYHWLSVKSALCACLPEAERQAGVCGRLREETAHSCALEPASPGINVRCLAKGR